jgi:hypothetical protein
VWVVFFHFSSFSYILSLSLSRSGAVFKVVDSLRLQLNSSFEHQFGKEMKSELKRRMDESDYLRKEIADSAETFSNAESRVLSIQKKEVSFATFSSPSFFAFFFLLFFFVLLLLRYFFFCVCFCCVLIFFRIKSTLQHILLLTHSLVCTLLWSRWFQWKNLLLRRRRETFGKRNSSRPPTWPVHSCTTSAPMYGVFFVFFFFVLCVFFFCLLPLFFFFFFVCLLFPLLSSLSGLFGLFLLLSLSLSLSLSLFNMPFQWFAMRVAHAVISWLACV